MFWAGFPGPGVVSSIDLLMEARWLILGRAHLVCPMMVSIGLFFLNIWLRLSWVWHSIQGHMCPPTADGWPIGMPWGSHGSTCHDTTHATCTAHDRHNTFYEHHTHAMNTMHTNAMITMHTNATITIHTNHKNEHGLQHAHGPWLRGGVGPMGAPRVGLENSQSDLDDINWFMWH